MIVSVEDTDGIDADTVDNAMCVEDITGKEPKSLNCFISQYAALDADTYQILFNHWKFDDLTYPKDTSNGLNQGINEWTKFEGCGGISNSCRDKQMAKVDLRQDRSDDKNTLASRKKILKG